MHLPLSTCVVRSWREEDALRLPAHANNRRIWLNLRDMFPHPFTVVDADTFISYARAQRPETLFAVEVDGQAVGGIGYVVRDDIERVSAEIGYWLGESYWGRGIMTEALKAVTRYAIRRHGLTRVFAVPFVGNVASCRVLEKAGFVLEGRMRRSAIKDGVIVDQLLYAFVVPEIDASDPPAR
jgi:ribosomal-protein-alanine N-acetyltransferase